MVRAVTEKNQKRALELYYDLLTLKEPPMRILFLLAKQYRQLLLAKQFAAAGLAQTEIASKLGVPRICCEKHYKHVPEPILYQNWNRQ